MEQPKKKNQWYIPGHMHLHSHSYSKSTVVQYATSERATDLHIYFGLCPSYEAWCPFCSGVSSWSMVWLTVSVPTAGSVKIGDLNLDLPGMTFAVSPFYAVWKSSGEKKLFNSTDDF